MSFNPRTDLAGEIGSDEHYQNYKAEYEMKQKTEMMKEDIKEVRGGLAWGWARWYVISVASVGHGGHGARRARPWVLRPPTPELAPRSVAHPARLSEIDDGRGVEDGGPGRQADVRAGGRTGRHSGGSPHSLRDQPLLPSTPWPWVPSRLNPPRLWGRRSGRSGWRRCRVT